MNFEIGEIYVDISLPKAMQKTKKMKTRNPKYKKHNKLLKK